jgi:hypothetical protein
MGMALEGGEVNSSPVVSFRPTDPVPMSDRAVAALAVGVTVGVAIAVSVRRPVEYVLHVYDHCPFCNRVEWLMQRHGLAYRRVLYGYGAGARPDKCDGHGYGEGPLHLTGQKMLPVLEGPGVPCTAGHTAMWKTRSAQQTGSGSADWPRLAEAAGRPVLDLALAALRASWPKPICAAIFRARCKGLPESMEICAYLIGRHKLVVPCESGRTDLKRFTQELTELKPALCEHRMVRIAPQPLSMDICACALHRARRPIDAHARAQVRMPIEDWADQRDVAYRRYKKKLTPNMPPPPVVPQPAQIAQLEAKLAELPPLLRGKGCANAWGWGMDDVVLLPLLRSFTCVAGVSWPAEVEAYLGIERTQMIDYRKHAL